MAPHRLSVGGNDGFSSGIMEMLAGSLFVLWVIVPLYDFAKEI